MRPATLTVSSAFNWMHCLLTALIERWCHRPRLVCLDFRVTSHSVSHSLPLQYKQEEKTSSGSVSKLGWAPPPVILFATKATCACARATNLCRRCFSGKNSPLFELIPVSSLDPLASLNGSSASSSAVDHGKSVGLNFLQEGSYALKFHEVKCITKIYFS